MTGAGGETGRLVRVTLDEDMRLSRSPEVEHERRVAIFDLTQENSFALTGSSCLRYILQIGLSENRLVLNVRDEDDTPLEQVVLPLAPLRKLIRDYFRVCDAYYEAIRTASPSKIEAIDMGRRGLHNEGAETLRNRLAGRIDIDEPTSRRLFTLICVLHVREWRQ